MAFGILATRFETTGRVRAALLASSALAAALLLPAAQPAWAQDATWLANPGSADINTGSNWDTGTVPTGTAFFGTSATTALTLNTSATFDGWTFNAGASNYTVTATYPAWLQFVGAGIVVNGGSVAITNGHVLIFYNASTAGSATIANTGNMSFYNSSSAGSAVITNDYSLNFGNSSTADSATIINNFGLSFGDTATAGSATITNSSSGIMAFSATSSAGSAGITNNGSIAFNNASSAGGASIDNNGTLTFYNATTAGDATITNSNGHTTEFRGNSTAGNAQLINNGASAAFDFSGTVGPNSDNKVSAGSIAGDGTFNLGANELTVGGNNLSTAVSGVISGSGPLVKTGTGTMTLSGTNTYTGGTTFAGGTVSVSSDANLGGAAGSLTFNGGSLQVTGTAFTSTARAITLGAGGGTFDIADAANSFSVTQGMTGTGGLTKTGAGTLILSGANTYTGATTVSAGILDIQDSIASSTVTNNARLNYSDSATAGSASITNNTGGAIVFYGSSTAGNANITNNAILNFNSGSTAGNATIYSNNYIYLSGVATLGTATVTNAVGGIFQFSGNSTAANGTITNNADLTFSDSSTGGSASITNNNQLTFYGNTSAGSATINNQGTVLFDGNSTAGSAQLINNGSSSVINFWTPGPASDGRITAGSLAGDGRFDLNSAELTVGSNNLSTVVTGVLTGDGLVTGTSLIKTGTGTLILSGTNTYTGGTTVDGGTLLVNGSIASSPLVLVNPGATLGGTGTVATTFLDSGATLAPGTPGSIGTLTVQGNLTFCNCSIYAVKVSPTGADKTVVTGQAALGGTVRATALAGSFRGQTYTILNATGGLGGTQFANLTFTGSSISPGARNPHLTYDANNVYLVLDPGTLQLAPGASGNQTNVAGGINNAVLGGGAPPAGFDALLNMSGVQQGTALNQVSGQPGASSTQASFNATQQFMSMLDPASGRGGGPGGAMSYAEDDETLGYASVSERDAKATEAYAAVTPRDRRAVAFQRRWGVWATGYGGTSTVNGSTSSGTSTTTSRVYGTVVGADYRATPDTLIGFALGGAGFNFSLSDGLGSGKADLFQAGLYSRHTMGAAYLSMSLTYGWQDVTTDRTVTVSGTDKLTANYKASTFAGRAEAGWRFAPWPASGVGVTPYAALQATSFHLPGYSETATSGSNTFALSYNAQTTTNVRTELGTRLDRPFLVRDGLFTLRGRLAWAHDSNTGRSATTTFQTLPGSTFTTNGAQPTADSALISAGAKMDWLNGITLAGSFEGEFSSTTRSYAGKATLRYDW